MLTHILWQPLNILIMFQGFHQTKKLGASMRTKTSSSMLDSGGQIMTEMQHRWKLTGASGGANLTLNALS